MGLMDRLKGLLKGRETHVKGGIDKASDAVEKAVGPKHAAKVDQVSEKAKDVVDDLTGNDAPSTPTAPAPSPGAATASPSTVPTPPPVDPAPADPPTPPPSGTATP